MTKGPQIVTRHGEAAVVVVAVDEYKELVSSKPSFTDFLPKKNDKYILYVGKRKYSAYYWPLYDNFLQFNHHQPAQLSRKPEPVVGTLARVHLVEGDRGSIGWRDLAHFAIFKMGHIAVYF